MDRAQSRKMSGWLEQYRLDLVKPVWDLIKNFFVNRLICKIRYTALGSTRSLRVLQSKEAGWITCVGSTNIRKYLTVEVVVWSNCTGISLLPDRAWQVKKFAAVFSGTVALVGACKALKTWQYKLPERTVRIHVYRKSEVYYRAFRHKTCALMKVALRRINIYTDPDFMNGHLSLNIWSKAP